ncbi:MAG: hypothetical protein ACXQTR_02450 [Candidatus Methanospirareceae archaeon]
MKTQKVQWVIPYGYSHAFLLFIGILLTGMIITAPIGIPIILYALRINKQYRKQQEEREQKSA